MVLGLQDLRRPGRGLATDGRPSRVRGLRRADEQHAQVRRVPDAEQTIGVERHPAEGNLAESVSSLEENTTVTWSSPVPANWPVSSWPTALSTRSGSPVSPYLWSTGDRSSDDVGAVRLELVSTTTFPSGVVRLRDRPAPAETPSTG